MTEPHLTPREREVCDLLVQGLRDKEIAHRLGGLSIRTIEQWRASVFKKHGVTNAVQLVRAVYHLDDRSDVA